MVDWKRNNQVHNTNYHKEAPTTSARSQNKKPPPGSWKPSVPQWEKKFCTTVGSVPWGKLVEAKKLMSYYENVVQWNDSAGEEAFHNAKSRFWAKINGLPCDIALPDPDIYIDEIDWNSEIDPELILDLDREPMVPDDNIREEKVGFQGNTLLFMNHPVPCTGWGDTVEETMNNSPSGPGSRDINRNSANEDNNPWECSRAVENIAGWGDAEEDQIRIRNNLSSKTGFRDRSRNLNDEENPWESNHSGANVASEDRKWGNGGKKSWGWKQWEKNSKECDSLESRRTSRGWGQWEGNWRKREGASQHMSRYKTSRFQFDDQYQMGGGWKNDGRGRKRVNFAYDRPLIDKKPFTQQPSWNSIHQIGHHGFSESGSSLWRSWDKQVS